MMEIDATVCFLKNYIAVISIQQKERLKNNNEMMAKV